MNPEHKQKIVAARQENAKRFFAQTIIVDNKWKITRPDECNWELEYKGRGEGYYGNLADAFRALNHKMLSKVAKTDLQEIIRVQRGIVAKIETALDTAGGAK